MIESRTNIAQGLAMARPSESAEVYSCLSHLESYYPDFERWYWDTVVPGITEGTRMVRVVRRDDEIIAALIAKRECAERKLCTLWVRPDFVGHGVGVRLIEEGRRWVGEASPLASVPEERMPELGGILVRMGFVLTQKLDSFYRPGKAEFVFNGRLAALNS